MSNDQTPGATGPIAAQLASFQHWLCIDADSITYLAGWLGGIAWSQYADEICDTARRELPSRLQLRELHALFAGRLAEHGVCTGLPIHDVLESDTRPGDCATVAAGLLRGLRLMSAPPPSLPPSPLRDRIGVPLEFRPKAKRPPKGESDRKAS